MTTRRRLPSQGLHLSRGTYLFMLATVLIGLTAIDTDANLLLLLFGLCLGGFIVSAAAGWASLRRLEVSRVAPEGVAAGQPFTIRYQLTNNSRWLTAYSLHLVDVIRSDRMAAAPEGFVPVLRAGESVTLEVVSLGLKRGMVAFDQVAIGTRFPFGLFTKFATASFPWTLSIYPRLGAVRERRWLSPRWSSKAAEGSVRAPRGDDEFVGLREYRPGDNPRRIHWRRSAKAGDLLVREMTQSRADQFWCVIDTRIGSGDPALAERLEDAISAAATVACDAIESNGRVGIICNGEPLLVMPPGGGRDYRLRVLEELALRSAQQDDLLSERFKRMSFPLRWRAPCLLFAARAHDDTAEAVRLLSGVLGTTTLLVPGTPAFDSVYAARPTSARPRSGAAGKRRGGASSGVLVTRP